MPNYAAKMRAPFAVLGIRTGRGAVTGIEYLPGSERAQAPTDALAARACRQIERYLADAQFRFSLPLAPAGTAFRRRVWDTLSQIPIGESRTYGELARRLHTAPRAIGGFMGVTEGDPIAIKRWLLAHEGYRFGA
jgi:methylated-DNA-[protein]-cysteine S-methyltransferase